MAADPVDADLLTEGDVAALGERLEAYAANLTEREQRLLRVFLLSAMDPLERLRLTNPEGILSAEDEAILRAIDAEAIGG